MLIKLLAKHLEHFFETTKEAHLGRKRCIKIALLGTTCDSNDMSKPRCRETKVRSTRDDKQDMLLLLGKNKRQREPAAGESIGFLGTDVTSQNWVAQEMETKDRAYWAHVRCILNVVF